MVSALFTAYGVTKALTVCDNQARKARAVDGFNGLSTENAVGDDGPDLLGAMLAHCCSGLGKL